MGYRLPEKRPELEIKIDEPDVVTSAEIPLGCICTYDGPVSALAVQDPEENEIEEEDPPCLLISKRDLLAALNRMLCIDDPSYHRQFEEPGVYLTPESDLLEQADLSAMAQQFRDPHISQFVHHQNFEQDQKFTQTTDGLVGMNQVRLSPIPDHMIKALTQALKDKVTSV